jgi:hypothetical protein
MGTTTRSEILDGMGARRCDVKSYHCIDIGTMYSLETSISNKIIL